MHKGDDLIDRSLRRLRHLLGRHLVIGQPVGQQRPAREVLLHLVHGGIGLEVELAGGLGAGMTGNTVFADKGLHRVVQTVLQVSGIRGESRGGDGQKQTQNQQSHA